MRHRFNSSERSLDFINHLTPMSPHSIERLLKSMESVLAFSIHLPRVRPRKTERKKRPKPKPAWLSDFDPESCAPVSAGVKA